MSLLKPHHFHRMREHFLQQSATKAADEQGLSREEFVRLMRACLKDSFTGTEEDLVSSVNALFNQVDENSDGTLELSELITYIIDSGLLHKTGSFMDVVREQFVLDHMFEDKFRGGMGDSFGSSSDVQAGVGGGSAFGGSGSASLSMSSFSASSMSSTAASASTTTAAQQGRRKFRVIRAVEQLGRVFVVDDVKGFRVLDAESGATLQAVSSGKFSVLAFEYDALLKLVFVSTSDGKVSVYDSYFSGNAPLDVIPFQVPQRVLLFLPTRRWLCSASIGGLLSIVRVEPTIIFGKIKMSFVGSIQCHADSIEDMLEIPYLDCVVTASMDSSIRLWDCTTKAQRKVLRGHARGVVSLAFSQDQYLLFSASLDRAIHVWDTVVGTLLFKLTHTKPLVKVAVCNAHNMLISADQSGNYRIWDILSLTMKQAWYDPSLNRRGDSSMQLEAFSLCVGPQTKTQFLFSGTTSFLSRFKYCIPDRTMGAHLADQKSAKASVSHVLFNDLTLTMMTVAECNVSMWDVVSGNMANVRRNVSASEVSAACLASDGRKFYLGDVHGRVREFNYSSMVQIQELDGHNKEVSFLQHGVIGSHIYLVSGSWDGTCRIYEDHGSDSSGGDKGLGLKYIVKNSSTQGDILCGALSTHMGCFAVGCSDGSVRLYDVFGAGALGSMPQHDGDVCAMVFLDPFPMLATSDLNGRIYVWAVHPAANRGALMCCFENTPPEEDPAQRQNQSHSQQDAGAVDDGSGGYVPVAVTVLRWIPSSQSLMTADEGGRIRILDMRDALEHAQMPRVSRPVLKYLRFEFSPYQRATGNSLLSSFEDPPSGNRTPKDGLSTRRSRQVRHLRLNSAGGGGAPGAADFLSPTDGVSPVAGAAIGSPLGASGGTPGHFGNALGLSFGGSGGVSPLARSAMQQTMNQGVHGNPPSLVLPPLALKQASVNRSSSSNSVVVGSSSLIAERRGSAASNAGLLDVSVSMDPSMIRFSPTLFADRDRPIGEVLVLDQYGVICVLSDDILVFALPSGRISADVKELRLCGTLPVGSESVAHAARDWNFFTPAAWGARRLMESRNAREIEKRIGKLKPVHIKTGPYAGNSQEMENFDRVAVWRTLIAEEDDSLNRILLSDKGKVFQRKIEQLEQVTEENRRLMEAVLSGRLPIDALSDERKRVMGLHHLRRFNPSPAAAVPPPAPAAAAAASSAGDATALAAQDAGSG